MKIPPPLPPLRRKADQLPAGEPVATTPTTKAPAQGQAATGPAPDLRLRLLEGGGTTTSFHLLDSPLLTSPEVRGAVERFISNEAFTLNPDPKFQLVVSAFFDSLPPDPSKTGGSDPSNNPTG